MPSCLTDAHGAVRDEASWCALWVSLQGWGKTRAMGAHCVVGIASLVSPPCAPLVSPQCGLAALG